MTTFDDSPPDAASDTDLLAHSQTEVAVARAQRTGRRRGRRPVRRAMVLAHRWPSLVLGLLLVLETSSGAVLLYDSEYFRATHASLYEHTASAREIGPDAAVAAVAAAAPDFAPIWAARDRGIWAVGNADYQEIYAVDPGTGAINGHAGTDGGVMGFLVNLHDCALTCEGYPGYVSWLGDTVPTLGLSFLTGITWGGFALGVLGLLMILLAVTGIVTWWPGRTRLRHGFRVRTGKGRFARDHDLHNVIGIVAVPFILMWGITGAAFEFPVVEKVWLAVTGGEQVPEGAYTVEPNAAAADRPDIGVDAAVAVALHRVPGRATFIGLPSEGAEYYEIDVVTGSGSYEARAFYGGDAYVYVDAHDATNVAVFDDGSGPLANRFYDKYLEPTHFGWNVNGWWRIIWFVLGTAPLGLMVTGVSTWLFRRGTTRRRRALQQARAVAAAPTAPPAA